MYNLPYKSVDVMKKSKDTLTNQLSTAEKTNLVGVIKSMGVTHIAISVPMDDNAVWVSAGSTPSPRTAEAEVQDWCDVIHNAGLNVMHRGTFGGVENIFNVAYDTGTANGTSATAATDVNTTWCGRYYRYLNNHVSFHVQTGDIFAPIPEGTTHAFDGHFFMSSQANYMALFPSFHAITNTYASAQGVSVTFMSHNNFSEPASGWIAGSLFSDQNLVGCDYYGQRQGGLYVNPADYVKDWSQLYLGKDSNGGGSNNAGGYNQFWGEWGDLPTAWPSGGQSIYGRYTFLINFYKDIRDNLVPPNGNLIGYNYWGGWEGQNTSLLYKDTAGNYQLNGRGRILQSFFKSNGAKRVSVNTDDTNQTFYG